MPTSQTRARPCTSMEILSSRGNRLLKLLWPHQAIQTNVACAQYHMHGRVRRRGSALSSLVAAGAARKPGRRRGSKGGASCRLTALLLAPLVRAISSPQNMPRKKKAAAALDWPPPLRGRCKNESLLTYSCCFLRRSMSALAAARPAPATSAEAIAR